MSTRLTTLTLLGLVTLGSACNKNSAPPAVSDPDNSADEMEQQGGSTSGPVVFDTLDNGDEVTQYTMTNSNGVEVSVISWGGIITSLKTHDKDGKLGDVVLGFDNVDGYIDNPSFFGALIGRYGNRIGNAEFTIDGVTYPLEKNDGDNHLHGGFEGFDKKNWSIKPIDSELGEALELTLTSPDGEQGYPGNLEVTVVYTLTDDDELLTDFEATTDQTTHVNLTQHSYFNLGGEGTILDHELTIPASNITPVDSGLIPTGELMDVTDTPFDFRTATAIGARVDADDEQLGYGKGYDHNYALDKTDPEAFALAATLHDPESGRVMEIYTDEPGIQFYSGNFLDGSITSRGFNFAFRGALCLEPQHFPDSPNKPNFASTLLHPGEVYEMHMSYKFDVK